MQLACRGEELGPALANYGYRPLGAALRAIADTVPSAVASDVAERNIQDAARSAAEARRHLDDSVRANEQRDDSSKVALAHMQDLAERTRGDTATLLRGSRRQVRELKDEFRSEWKALKRTYDLKLKTAAPYNYWKIKRVHHQRSAKRWGQVFSQTLVFGPILLAGVSAIFVASNAKFEPPYILPISCLAVPAFTILWAARLANRKYNEEQLRAEDANERGTMVKTLLALTRKDQSDSDIADAEMAIMLTALFRPGPGLNSEDSPAVSVLETALKAIRGDGK